MHIFDIFYNNPNDDNLELIINRNIIDNLLLDMFKNNNNELIKYVIDYLYTHNKLCKLIYNKMVRDSCYFNNMDMLVYIHNKNNTLFNGDAYLSGLYPAVKNNNYDIVKYLLNLNISINNNQPIIIYREAFEKNVNIDIINLLLLYYPIDTKEISDHTIINILQNGSIDIFLLLEKYDKKLYSKLSLKDMFINSCGSNNLELVKYIFNKNKSQIYVYTTYNTIDSACSLACSRGNINIVKFLFTELEQKPDLKYNENRFINNSVKYNYIDLFYYLLNLYKINKLYINGSKLLENALYGGNMEIINYIMDNLDYMNIDDVFLHSTPLSLYEACYKKDLNYIKFIFDLFEKINKVKDDKVYEKYGWRFDEDTIEINMYICFVNACYNSIEVMEFIYEKITDYDKKRFISDDDGLSKILYRINDNKEKLEFLLKNFYTIDLLDTYETLLYNYYKYNNIDCSIILCLYVPIFKIKIKNGLIKINKCLYKKYGIDKNNIIEFNNIMDCSICLENDNSDKKNKLLYLNCEGENKHIMHLQCLIVSHFLTKCPACTNDYDIKDAKIVKFI